MFLASRTLVLAPPLARVQARCSRRALCYMYECQSVHIMLGPCTRPAVIRDLLNRASLNLQDSSCGHHVSCALSNQEQFLAPGSTGVVEWKSGHLSVLLLWGGKIG
jgi:hypothetical protein